AARSSIGDCLRRAALAGVSWPLPPDCDEAELERRLYPPAAHSSQARPAIDFAEVQRQLRQRGVTLALLWQEYKERFPDGFQYSRYCELYRAWLARVDVVMRQEHRVGEKLFVDYAGQTIPIVDRRTCEICQAQIFVAVLGASSYTYAEATLSQALPDWLGAHVRAFEFFGGCPQLVVPDNLKSGVLRAHRYEPELNPAYQELADHYGVAVLPTRVRKPRDKAKVEAGVLLVERWILARLRHQTFFSIEQLNREIAGLLIGLNDRPFRKLSGSRTSQFQALDRPALRPLPAQRYEYAEWRRARVNIDYHIEFDGHFYSAPYTLARQNVDLRATESTVEILHRGQRVASHRRSARHAGHTTIAEHMPSHHRHQAEWTPERLGRWATQIGAATAKAVAQIIASRAHPEQGFRAAMGVLRLARDYSPTRLEAACVRALHSGACRYRSIESILKTGLDQRPLPATETPPLPEHDNVRGPRYYH
ncbi:MAG: IS21 family transposase, partial [Xanthomonadales bacterium]|nr:IS21 family transposase [Xanthomonadales bacterium]